MNNLKPMVLLIDSIKLNCSF